MKTVKTNGTNKMKTLPQRFNMANCVRHFVSNKDGVAAVEMAVLFPLLAMAFILMVDVAQAVTHRYDTERKMRLAIEGVLRYGDDMPKVAVFANGFSGSVNDPSRGGTLTVGPYKVCRSTSDTEVFEVDETPTCPNPESWYKIAVENSVNGMFGSTFDISTSTDLFSE